MVFIAKIVLNNNLITIIAVKNFFLKLKIYALFIVWSGPVWIVSIDRCFESAFERLGQVKSSLVDEDGVVAVPSEGTVAAGVSTVVDIVGTLAAIWAGSTENEEKVSITNCHLTSLVIFVFSLIFIVIIELNVNLLKGV